MKPDFLSSRRAGKTLAAVEATKTAQRAGKRVLWVTLDQAKTATTLAKHGALSEIVGDAYVRPHFREQDIDEVG